MLTLNVSFCLAARLLVEETVETKKVEVKEEVLLEGNRNT